MMNTEQQPESQRIAIFQYKWPLQSFTANILLSLADYGFKVDFYFVYWPSLVNQFIDIEQLTNHPNVKIYLFDADSFELQAFPKKETFIKYLDLNSFKNQTKSIFRSIIQKNNVIASVWSTLKRMQSSIGNSNEPVVEPHYSFNEVIVSKSEDFFCNNNYLCLIGIEKTGLIWAGELGLKYNVPYLYYSLEIVIEGDPWISQYASLREPELYFHKRANATIIQDSHRAEVLYKYNKIDAMPTILLPVSIKGRPNFTKDKYFKRKLGIPCEKTIILYFGMIDSFRFSVDIARNSLQWQLDNFLVFHGFGPPSEIRKILDLKNNNLAYSSELVSSNNIQSVISSADIGLVLYSTKNPNDRHTAFSSEKIALYLQSGIPIIAFRSESYEYLIEQYKCGELIGTIDEIPVAIEIIKSSYSSYRENCFLAFEKFYDFDLQFKTVIKFLESNFLDLKK